ncbi:MAG: BMC domain-containing protein [Oscillospiraceae bacterium]|nr:BMC domain-containing protein [Oscillospiraceae bacterium]
MSDIFRQRTIQEYVPGKQITLCHIIAKPDFSVYQKLGLSEEVNQAIGILTITPAEAAIIAADTCTKAAKVKVGFLDRFSGSVVITGEIFGVERALGAVLAQFSHMQFDAVEITRS